MRGDALHAVIGAHGWAEDDPIAFVREHWAEVT